MKTFKLAFQLGLGLLLTTAIGCGDDDDDPTPANTLGSDEDSSTSGDMDMETTGDSGGQEGSDSGPATDDGGRACAATSFALPGDAFYPEGIASDGEDILYVGSVGTGEIVKVSICEDEDGEADAFIPADSAGRAAIGLRLDGGRDMLWVCKSDPVNGALQAALEGYSLADGSLVATHAFEGDEIGFCNDITLDDAGNVYMTDSFNARILRVPADAAETDTAPELWLEDAEFEVGEGEFGLNGIAWDAASNTVRVVVSATGRMLEVPINEDGGAGVVNELLAADSLSSPDGMVPYGDRLLVVQNGVGSFNVVSVDLAAVGDPLGIVPVAESLDYPTTVAVVGDTAWVALSQFDHLFGFDPNPPKPFQIVRIEL